MSRQQMSSILCLCFLISFLTPGCAKVEPPPSKIQPPKPEIQLPELKTATDYVDRGISHFEKGRYDLAISDFGLAIAMDPKNAAAYSHRGDTYLLTGRYDEAIADFSEVIEINPKLSVFYYLRGNAYFKKEDYANTWNDYHKAQALGFIIPPKVLQNLREASGRER